MSLPPTTLAALQTALREQTPQLSIAEQRVLDALAQHWPDKRFPRGALSVVARSLALAESFIWHAAWDAGYRLDPTVRLSWRCVCGDVQEGRVVCETCWMRASAVRLRDVVRDDA